MKKRTGEILELLDENFIIMRILHHSRFHLRTNFRSAYYKQGYCCCPYIRNGNDCPY